MTTKLMTTWKTLGVATTLWFLLTMVISTLATPTETTTKGFTTTGFTNFTYMSKQKRDMQPRTAGGVFLCPEPNWGGECGFAVQPPNECITLGSDWDQKIGSIGPDPTTVVLLYETQNCSIPGHSGIFAFEGGIDNLADRGWNQRARSFWVEIAS